MRENASVFSLQKSHFLPTSLPSVRKISEIVKIYFFDSNNGDFQRVYHCKYEFFCFFNKFLINFQCRKQEIFTKLLILLYHFAIM